MEKINIIIKKDGSIEYSVHGVKGKSCRDLTKLIDMLGNVVETKNTSEYEQPSETNLEREYT